MKISTSAVQSAKKLMAMISHDEYLEYLNERIKALRIQRDGLEAKINEAETAISVCNKLKKAGIEIPFGQLDLSLRLAQKMSQRSGSDIKGAKNKSAHPKAS